MSPNWKNEITKRLGDGSNQIEPSILEELAQHLEARFEELQSYDAVMSEWSPEELRAELARIRRRRAETVTAGAPASSLWHGMWQDLRYGLRQLRLSPGFAAVAILSLALGVGANTAIFQLVDAVRLRTLPVDHPDNLFNIKIAGKGSRSGNFTGNWPQSTYAMWEQIREKQQGFSGLAAWGADTFDLATAGESHMTRDGVWVSGSFFEVLGVRPEMGRVFTAADDQPGCAGAAVISHAFWQREYGADPSVVGRKISLEGHPFEVIGVTPATFFGVEVGRYYDVALPLCANSILSPEYKRVEKRNCWWLAILGRLKPDWTQQRAVAQLEAVSPIVFQEAAYPKWGSTDAKNFAQFKLGAFPADAGFSDLRKEYQDPLNLLQATAGLVLLIACANLANLMLARASARERELAVRLAMGASRGRLIRQLLTESLLLAVFGTAVGATIAPYASRFLISFLSTDVSPIFVDLHTDWRMFGFLAGMAILTCLLFGLAPAIKATRAAPITAMKAGARGATQGRERLSLRRSLVVSQVALSLVLLVGSLLFIRTLTNLLNVDAGFQQNGIWSVSYDPTKMNLPMNARLQFHRDMVARIRAVPGVDAAGDVAIPPISGSGWANTLFIEGDEAHKDNEQMNRVGPGYFDTMRTAFLAGRDFTDHDNMSSTQVAIVTETFARKYLGGRNPVGRRFHVPGEAGEPDRVYEIVGMVRDSKYYDLRDKASAIVYFPAGQEKEPDPDARMMVRSSLPPTTLLPELRQAMGAASPMMTYHFRGLREQVLWSLKRERLMAALSGLFGLLAVSLAMAGLYGVISYTVARRTQEIGIRMALGADRSRILGMILHEAGILLGIGLVTGAGLALYASKVATTLLYNLQPDDPVTFAAAAVVLATVAVAASYLPAWRASQLDPMSALREE
jgi:putative ABC transport system permease protein